MSCTDLGLRWEMSYTTEQPSSFDFEECCICAEEFSNDTDLAAHLLQHAEESIYNTNSEDSGFDNANSPENSPLMTPTKENFPEYTRTSLVKPQNLRKSFTRRSVSPEVWEINSDDSADEQPQQVQRQQPMTATQNNVTLHNGQPLRSVGRPVNNVHTIGSKQYSQMAPPFNCNTCSSVFTDPKLFRDHLLTHEKPRPYSCNICNKTFAYKGTLRQHLRLHIGEKLHECPSCHKRFTIKAVLRKHCEEMHGIYTN